MKVVNPATNEQVKEYPDHSEDDVNELLEKAEATFQTWKDVPLSQKKELMLKAADLLRERKAQYAEIMTIEMGKPISQAESEVEKCAWVCEYYAENAEQFLEDEIVDADTTKSFVAFEPIGVVLAVMPWNFPFWQVFRFAAPALMAGNVGVLKHASNVPGSALAIEEVFRDAGFPDNAFTTLLISSKLVDNVINNDIVKAVTLTGSEYAGSKVAESAGRNIKKTVLELGGSDPFIVLADADMPTCVQTAANARMINTGQSCIAAKRFIVVKSRLQEFEQAYVDLFSKYKVGDPMDAEVDVGPMARSDLVDELDKQVQDSVSQGARVLIGGKRPDMPGAFYEPTIVTDVTPDITIGHEETFGPVAAIIPVEDEEEAIKVANSSRFGLGASLWTKDKEKGERLARRIESGSVFVNSMVKSDPRLPFGGIKKSGYGRELSYYGMKEFLNIKTIWIN